MKNYRFYIIEYADGEFSIQSNPTGGGLMLDLPRNMNRQDAMLFVLGANATLEALGMLAYESANKACTPVRCGA